MLKRIKQIWHDYTVRRDEKYKKRTGRNYKEDMKESMDKLQAKNINIKVVLNKHKLDFSMFTPETIKEVAPFKKGV